jgi:hypothetical protein
MASPVLADLFYTTGDTDLSEGALMARERAAVVNLIKRPTVLERMSTIRTTGRRPEDLR